MEDINKSDVQEIKDTDIIFECPHCSKSLAIDYHAAGLSIPCTDCAKLVVVPIPDGMEISDLDSTEQDQGALIIHLRESLLDCQTRMRLLESMVENFKKERRESEARQAGPAADGQFAKFAHDVETISRAVDQINAALASMAGTIREHSRQEQ